MRLALVTAHPAGRRMGKQARTALGFVDALFALVGLRVQIASQPQTIPATARHTEEYVKRDRVPASGAVCGTPGLT